ncbi:MAG: DNA polymerase Y family protein, partial [Pseudomonadota bacterium]
MLRPGICAFGARGPARYFGGEAALASKVIEAVAGLGFDCGAGIADGMFAALLASRDALTSEPARQVIVPPPVEAFLAPRSVTVLGEPGLAELLSRLGLRTLGEFAAIPESEAESRFGPQGLLAHRLASGADPRPLAARPPAADMSASLEFDPPALSSEQVIFAAKSLAGQMHANLAGSGLACV